MAHYLVNATPITAKLPELKQKLEAGTFISLSPFGKPLSYSLENARIRENGMAAWEEEDYCSPPLKEEKEAVLDDYFEDIEVERVKEGEGWAEISKLPLLFRTLT